ncbi:hypothetical protein PWT90_01191 [Aphanocladium album]|nr:hypothetical protein PWT90_01191 [Aphanocladium album]
MLDFPVMTLLFFSCIGAIASAANIVAYTTHGTMHGVQIHSNVNAFLGIPYAQPPTGELQFDAPKPIQRMTNTSLFQATTFGKACHQFKYRGIFGNASFASTPESEDCLTLNIHVPSNVAAAEAGATKKLPVYVWSFGGGFGEGAGSISLYDPTDFVAENKDIIVISWK